MPDRVYRGFHPDISRCALNVKNVLDETVECGRAPRYADTLQQGVQDLVTDPEPQLSFCAAEDPAVKTEPTEGAAAFPGAPSGDAGWVQSP